MKAVAISLLLLIVVVAARRNRNGNRLNCKYNKGEWSECDTKTNMVSRVFTLTSGEEGCNETQTQTISCKKLEQIQTWKAEKIERRQEKMEQKQQSKERKNLLKEQRKRCNYDFGDWSECDAETNTVTRTLTLLDAEEGCEPIQTITLSCEKFNRIQENRPERHQQWKEERKQQRKERKQKMREERLRCKYDKGNWSECDNTTNTVTRTLTLRDGEEGCEPNMEITITCDRYERIQAWKAKKLEIKNERMAEKNLRKKEKNVLRETFRKIKEQRKLGCDFEVSFSECDSTTNMVTKTYTPTSSDDESCDVTSVKYSCDMHNRMMEKKMKRQNKKAERKSERQEIRRRIFRGNEQ